MPLGHGDPPGLERPIRLAALRQRDPPGLLRRRPRRARRGGPQGLPADPRHEPGLHRQGRLLHRHQAGPAVRRDAARRRRGLGDARLARHRAPLSRRGARQGLAAADLRRPPRRHHRLRVRPGLHRPAHRLAGARRPRRDRARRRHRRPRRPGRPGRWPRPGRLQLRELAAAGRADGRRSRAGPAGRHPPAAARGTRRRRAAAGRRAGGAGHRAQGAPARRGFRTRLGPGRGDDDPQRVLRGDGRPGARRRRQRPAGARRGRGRPGAAAPRRHRQRTRRPGGVPEAPPLRRGAVASDPDRHHRRPQPERDGFRDGGTLSGRVPPHRHRRPRPVPVHTEAVSVDGRRPARRVHHHRRLRRRRPAHPGALAVRRAGRAAGARGGGRGDRARVRVRGGGQRAVPVDAGQPGEHLVRPRLHRAGRGPRRLRRLPRPARHRSRRAGVPGLGRRR
ncbi:basic proline-rich protein precursor [Streptomyces sp. NL15-2K]|nr:basic proline-rich protein precursor [Streptomyces sp. NL15-2K]